jgi:hypothetical protein
MEPPALEQCPLGGVLDHGKRLVVSGSRLAEAAEAFEQVGPGGMEQVIPVEIDAVELVERRTGPMHLGEGDGPIERHDRRGGEHRELVVETHDLGPVGVAGGGSVGMYGGDGGLDL